MKKKRKMKSIKKAYWFLTVWALLMQSYVLIMIVKLQDTMSLSIVAGVVFGELVAFYLGYLKYSRDIDLKHMDKNYRPDYDNEEGKY